MDPNQTLGRVVTMSGLVDRYLAPRRFLTGLLGAFAALALLISTAGIYAVVSYSVGRRTHEIGIRMAIGARAGDVQRMILGEAAALGVLGLGIGVAGALALTPLLASQLYGITRTDPLTFALTTALLFTVVLLASYIPTRRATRIELRSALLHE